jgi:predicted NUDIX family phosphoesterase
MQKRIQPAESAMHERQGVLSEDHGGTVEERQAIADAKSGLRVLRRDAAEWQDRQTARWVPSVVIRSVS